MKTLVALALYGVITSAANCSSAGLLSTLNYFKNVSLSATCLSVGPWNASTKPIDFLTSLRDYIPLACTQSACRNDFAVAATNFQGISCDEAQAIGLALNGIGNICPSLTLANSTSKRCSTSDSMDLGSITAQCYGLLPNATIFSDVIMPTDLSSFYNTCIDSCLTSMLNRIAKLPTCLSDWPLFGGAPISMQTVYQTYIYSMCRKYLCYDYWGSAYLCSWYAPSNDYTSCSSQLATIYTTRFSTSCRNAVFNGSMAYVLQASTQGNYLRQSHRLGIEPSCRADVSALLAQLTNNCTSPLASGLQILQTVWQNNISYPNVSICNASLTAALNALLASPPPPVCANLGVNVATWLDVLLPARSTDLLNISSSSACSSAAMNFVKSFPSCEWLDASGLPMGMNASTRFSSFLVAANANLPPPVPTTMSPSSCNQPSTQALFWYYQNQTLSLVCSQYLPWSTTVRPIDFLSTFQSYIPLACSQSACQADFEASTNNLASLNCDEAKNLSVGMSKIVSICKTLTIATNSSMCSDSESFDMGALPLACANSITTTTIPKVLDIIFPPNLTAIDGICTHDCLKALIGRINTTLPNCQVEWPYLARAPVSPKILYKTFLNAVCGYDICFRYSYWYGSWSELCAWNTTSNNFSSCSAQLASLYSVPFSSTCYQAYKNTFGNQTVLLGRMYIIETVLTGLDFVKSRFLASTPSCVQDVLALAARINCPSSISVGFKTLRTSWSTNYTPTPGLNKCNQSTLATLLSAPLPYACYSNGFSSWTPVFLPYNLSSLSSLPRACAIAALAYTDTFPACEWIDEGVGETLVGINISTRVSSFLVAAQNLTRPSLTISLPTSSPPLYYYPTPAPTNYYPSSSPSALSSCYSATNSESALFKNYQSVNLSSACLAFGPWDQGTRAIDFIWRYPDYTPLACFQPACRADIEASAANFGSLSCAESLEVTIELRGLLSLCQRLPLALDEPLCDDWPYLGSIPSECVGVATSGSTTFLELIRSDNLAAMERTTCYSMSCTATISDKINSLPDCKMELQLAGGAPISPKMLYSSTFTAFCNRSALAIVDYNSCSSRLATLYTIPFSKTCNMVLSSIPMRLYVLQTAFTGDYLYQAQKIAATPACMQDVAAMKERLANVFSCAPDLMFASKVLQKVLTTTYISDRNLPLCSESQIFSGISLLETSAATSCTFNSKRSTWIQILLPDHLSDLAKTVKKTDCVDVALEIAKSLPNCEWASVTDGDIITGVNVATRISSFLLAAQSVNETTSTSLAVRYGLTSSLSIAVLATLVLWSL